MIDFSQARHGTKIRGTVREAVKVKAILLATVIGLFLYGPVTYAMTASADAGRHIVPNSAAAFAVQFQAAVKHKDLSFIAQHLAYPVPAYLFGSNKWPLYELEVSQRGYPDWMTPYLYDLIESIPPDKLVNMLDIRQSPSGTYMVHNLQYTADPDDHKYSQYAIDSDKALFHVLNALREGAEAHCEKCVADVIEFPIWACIKGQRRKIDRDEFLQHYDYIVNDYVRSLMAHAWTDGNWSSPGTLGIALGSEADIWIQSFAHENSQGLYVWETKVTSIGAVDKGCLP